MKEIRSVILFLAIFSLLSCSSYKPILDQNNQYLQYGDEVAKQEVAKCTKNADEYLEKYKMERAAKEAGRKAVIGAVVGAASGAIFGNNLKAIATSAAIGTVLGAAIGGAQVAGEGKVTPDHIKQNYISNCLARKGYQVIGWQ